MSRLDKDAFAVATMRNGKMAAVRRFGAGEVDTALRVVTAIREAGDEVNVTVFPRDDGLALGAKDEVQLRRAAK